MGDVRKYDMVVSLGGNCAAAIQLNFRGLRKYSLPFDYLFMVDDTTIKYLRRGFATRFREFFLRENMVELVGDERGDDRHGAMQYKDTYTGWRAIHHFYGDVFKNPDAYKTTMETFRRRIDRMFEKLESAHSVLFILGTPFEFDVNLMRDVQKYMRRMYPHATIDWQIVQFNASAEEHLARKIPHGNTYIDKYTRAAFFDDFATPDLREWAFVNDIAVSPCPKNYMYDRRRIYKLPFYLMLGVVVQLVPVRMLVSDKYADKLLQKITKWWR